jgi:hypothetical protein
MGGKPVGEVPLKTMVADYKRQQAIKAAKDSDGTDPQIQPA